MTQLTVLNLCRNKLTGAIPVELGQMTQLTKLDLCANQLTGAIPGELGQLIMTRLTMLDLQYTPADSQCKK